jgi:hypothetical protein
MQPLPAQRVPRTDGNHELMMVTPKIREMIFDAKSNADIRSTAITRA